MAAAVQVIQSAEAAEKLLKPERLQMLEMLAEPDTATGIAKRLGISRQTANYHLRELEKEGMVEFVEQRAKGNCLERVLRASARSYVISQAALGAVGAQPSSIRDQFSSAYLVSAAARAIADVSVLRQRAGKSGKKLATLTLETDVRFADAQARKDFTDELVNCIAQLAMKYHSDQAPGGRSFRFLLGGYPVITQPQPVDQSPVSME